MQTNHSEGFPADLLVALDHSKRRTLRAQLEHELRLAIQDGRLAKGIKLPASRALARQLGLARSVVVQAYANLVADGYLEARQGSATRVRGQAISRVERPPARHAAEPAVTAFVNGVPDLSSFPRREWRRHYQAVLNGLANADFAYPDPQGTPALRDSLTGHLGRARGVATVPDRILVCNGFAQGLAVVSRVLRRRGYGCLALEDPCFGYHRAVVSHAGLEPVPIRVDDSGLDVGELRRSGVRAVCVSPAHSYPMGAVLAPERRLELLDWARECNGLVVEDDYDAEFRYDRVPVGALQGLAPDLVVYGGSVSKTLSPLLRLGWLAAPGWLMADLLQEKFLDDMASGTLEQLTLARLLDQGDLARHLRRVRPRYRARRDAAMRALAEFMPQATPRGIAAGLHLFVALPEHCHEETIVKGARTRGVAVEGAAWHFAQPGQAPPALVLGYGALHEAEIERGIRTLATAAAEADGD